MKDKTIEELLAIRDECYELAKHKQMDDGDLAKFEEVIIELENRTNV